MLHYLILMCKRVEYCLVLEVNRSNWQVSLVTLCQHVLLLGINLVASTAYCLFVISDSGAYSNEQILMDFE